MPKQNDLPTPVTANQKFLAKAAGMDVELPTAITMDQMYLQAIAEGSGGGSGDAYTKAETDQLLDGKADLVDGKVPASELPSYVDDTVEGYYYGGAFYEDSSHTTAITGESGKIYIDLTANKSYRWTGTVYVRIDECPAFGETQGTIYEGNKGKANADAIAAIKDGTNIDSFGDVETALSGKANSTDLAAVATSGSYNDLTNKPTLGTAAAKGVDTAPTASSTNLVESGGVRNVVDVLEQMNGAKNRVNINVSEVKSLNSAPGYTWNRNSCTVNGVTFTINNDNTITTSGATQSGNSAVFTLCDFGPDGTSEFYGNILSGCARGGNYSTSYSLYLVKPDGNTLINNDDYNGAGTEIPKTDLVRYLRILFRKSTSADNLTFKPMICTKAAWDAGFTDFQPYAMSNRALYNDVNVLNQRIESFVYNPNTSKSIILSRASSATFLALGFVQGIGNIYWILEIDGSGNLTVKNGFDGSTVSAAGISFNKDTKTLTFTSQYNGNSNITIIMTSV